MEAKWYARERGSAEWHGGWDTRFDAVRKVAILNTCDPLPRDVVEEHYEFAAFGDCRECGGVGAMSGAHTFGINPCPYCDGDGRKALSQREP